MATQTHTSSPSPPREPEGSRATRRLRRSGQVPGVLYGGEGEPVAFTVDARELRHALAARGAVLEISDGESADARRPQGRPAPPGPRRDDARRPAPRAPQRGDPRGRRRRARPAATRPPASSTAACSTRSPARSTSRRCRTRSPSRSRSTSRRWRSTTRSTSPTLAAPDGVTLLDDLEETTLATLSPPRARDRGAPTSIETETERRRRGRGDAAPRTPTAATTGDGLRRVAGAHAAPGRGGLGARSTGSSSGSATPAPATPGRRHNIGFEVANALAARWDLPQAQGRSTAACFTEGRTGLGGPRVAVLLPQTYMNEAGRSVGPARGALKVDARARARASTTRSTCRSATSARASAAGWPATTV